VEKTSNRTPLGLAALLSMWAAVGCEPAGPRHEPADKTATAPALAARDSSTAVTGDSSSPAAQTPATGGRCVAPLAEPAPPVATPAARCPADPDGPLTLPQGTVRFADAPSTPRVSVERALDDAARARGLMYRTRLDADAGMLFSWDSEAPRSFWMRNTCNTCIPLDMLFIAADGTIVGILEQVPTLNTLPRAVPCPAKHVLEVNAGWTRQHGVLPGQKVEFET
jgi:uncharacterized protein